MPHIVIKLATGRSEAQKQRIADAVAQAIVQTADCGADAVSVAIEDVAKADWDAKVFVPEIAGKAATLYKKPGSIRRFDCRFSSVNSRGDGR